MMITKASTYLARVSAGYFPDILWKSAATSPPTLYLTFDDGPTGPGTTALMDLLDHYQARASFFLIGEKALQFPEQVKALCNAGHVIGNHSFTHPDAWRTPANQMLEEMDRTTEALTSLGTGPIQWMRPPYGHFTPSLRKWCQTSGQRMVLWDVLSGDFRPGASVEKMVPWCLRQIRPGSILIFHDNPKFHHLAFPVVEQILKTLTPKGWQFASL